MNSKLLILAGVAMICAPGAYAKQARIVFPASDTTKNIKVSHGLLDNMLKARSQADFKIVDELIPVSSGVAIVEIDSAGPAQYHLDFAGEDGIDFYTAPGEELTVNITSVAPLDYTFSGTPLMEGISELQAKAKALEERQKPLMPEGGEPDVAALKALYNEFTADMVNYIKTNPDNPAAVYALMRLPGEEFLNAYTFLGPKAKASILYPIVEAQKPGVERRVQQERMQKELASGTHDAPDFTLPDLNGKQVSLADFKGKWVIIDFWGSWCIWCIKGFPHLKETYEAYKDELVIIGVDCKDTQEAWKAAVEKYKLPWVNLYNDTEKTQILQTYGVQGFPTKAIVNPEGKLVDITTGEDPSFYTRLKNFMGK